MQGLSRNYSERDRTRSNPMKYPPRRLPPQSRGQARSTTTLRPHRHGRMATTGWPPPHSHHHIERPAPMAAPDSNTPNENPNGWRRPKRRAPATWLRPKRSAPDRTELNEYPHRLLRGPLDWATPTSGLAGPTRASRTAQTGPGQALASPTPAGPLARWPAGPLVLWPAGPLARWPAGPLVLWPAEPLARPAENRPAEPRRRTRLFALARFFDHTRLCTAGPATPQAVWVALAESWTATASLARSRARRSSELVS